VAFATTDPVGAARFWAALLGRELVEADAGALVPGGEAQLSLRFFPSGAESTEPHRLHLHVTSRDAAQQRETVGAALALGARHLDVGQRPEEGHVVLGDPEANPFCVIEPGNSFLEGCGLLGEIACEGTRDVGLFWSAALEWPLVWDQDEETAIQSPEGGTKVAWGGPPVVAPTAAQRQLFDVVVSGDPRSVVDDLLRLGATRRAADEDGRVALVDPDGVAFCVMTG
jgi:catechol 2,3-dioxygenase-like lactoylglutathione lyase family enzyme